MDEKELLIKAANERAEIVKREIDIFNARLKSKLGDGFCISAIIIGNRTESGDLIDFSSIKCVKTFEGMELREAADLLKDVMSIAGIFTQVMSSYVDQSSGDDEEERK